MAYKIITDSRTRQDKVHFLGTSGQAKSVLSAPPQTKSVPSAPPQTKSMPSAFPKSGGAERSDYSLANAVVLRYSVRACT
ncbi:MAG: hypothetical protein C5B49_03125 [Bdellovibrio sp.]|nr:MAG: hypothetical protein C5B49_03125 [Bdellovibrio sp.]